MCQDLTCASFAINFSEKTLKGVRTDKEQLAEQTFNRW